ncbi:MAG: glycosyltransferase family 4 protein [Candidatus Paceibacterota bacterium]|jgi:glycosyltransferase involved in cell wall biosynthesis
MKIAFIHNDKKVGTGAHYVNDLMARKLNQFGVEIKNFYPRISLGGTPAHLSGIKNILYFYSLLERRDEILKYKIIQGTTYTPLPFLAYPVPVVSHFGSTTKGFLDANSRNGLNLEIRKTWLQLKKQGAISGNLKPLRPLRDIADIEEYVAKKATAVIATSENVKKELIDMGVKEEKIHLIYNAIEDYWFEEKNQGFASEPNIVFLGRLGNDFFTLKLKGLDRLVNLYQHFPQVKKITFCMTSKRNLINWLNSKIPNHTVFANVQKDKIPNLLSPLRGSILFISSRYEGFSLSLIEGMSQGLVPVVYPVGVAPEIIINGENGFLVNSQAEAIEKVKVLLSDESLRKKISIEASKTAQQFSGIAIVQKLVNLYKSIA